MRFERYKHLLNFCANLISLSFEGVLFGYIWYTHYRFLMTTQFWNRGNWAVIGMYVLIIFFLTYNFGGYGIGYRRISDIVLSNILAIVFGNIIAYFEVNLIINDYAPVKPLASIALLEIIFIFIWTFIVRKAYASLYPPRQLLIIYGDHSPEEFMEKLILRDDKYNIRSSIHYSEGIENISQKLSQYNGVVLYDIPDQERNTLLKLCYRKGIRCYMTPKISDIIYRGADDIHLFDTPLYLCRNQGITIVQEFSKRIFDVIAGSIGLVLLSPVLLITALAVKLYDGGPVFYTQKRLTLDGKVFDMYKFRSMRVDSEVNGIQMTTKHDLRVTPVGNIIRNIHVDELPQLINIIKGDMSIVGPRPERPEIAAIYEEEIPEFSYRLKVKAGLTGYAQVFGKYNTSPYDKLKLDLTYIENYNFWLDIKILMLTFKILFVKDSTEGISDDKITASRKDS